MSLNRKPHQSLGKGKGGWSKETSLNSKSVLENRYTLKSKHQKTSISSNSKLEKGRARTGSTRLLGDMKEAILNNLVKDKGFKLEETQNSGATNFDGDSLIHLSDVEGDYFRSEVKYRNTSGFTVKKEHWETIVKKSLIHGGVPSLVTVNKEDQVLITLKVSDLLDILSQERNKK
jgi:hypothetical protein